MTGAVAVAVAVLAAAVVGAVIARHFGHAPTAVADRVDEPWLAEAALLVDEGRWLSEQVAAVMEEGALEPHPGAESADPSAGLERLMSRLAELSATAPTAMDARVCRSVAVQSRALTDVLGAQSARNPTRPSHGRSALAPVVEDRRHEFEVALRDLAEHVELL